MSNTRRAVRASRTTRREARPWRALASLGMALLAISSVAALGSGTPGASATALARSRPLLVGGLTFIFTTPDGNQVPYRAPSMDLGGGALGVEYGVLVTVENTSGRAATFPSPGAGDIEYAKPSTYTDEFLMDEEDCVKHSPVAAGGTCRLVLLWLLPATGTQKGAFTVSGDLAAFVCR